MNWYFFLLYGKYNAENTEKIVLTINSLQNITSRLECFFALKMNNLYIICMQELGISYFQISYNYIYRSVQKDIIDCMKPYLTTYTMF